MPQSKEFGVGKKEGKHEPACVVYMLSNEKERTHKIFIILSYKAEKKNMCNILIYIGKKLIYQFIILKYRRIFL